MNTATRDALADRLARYDRVVEVGVGRNDAVAAALAERGVRVTATDISAQATADGVAFVRDDVTAPDLSLYRGADAIYALNLPPELHRPTDEVAARVDADFLFTTLGGDPPAVSVDIETLPGETLYWARGRGGNANEKTRAERE